MSSFFDDRSHTLRGRVFADNAETQIPLSPVVGVPYRDTQISDGIFKNGWPFSTIVNSGDFNQIMYLMSGLLCEIEGQGILLWSNELDYKTGSVVRGTDGYIYRALQDSGPGTTAGAKLPNTIVNRAYWAMRDFRQCYMSQDGESFYVWFNNSILIQGGKGVVPANYAWVKVNLSIPFTSTSYLVFLSDRGVATPATASSAVRSFKYCTMTLQQLLDAGWGTEPAEALQRTNSSFGVFINEVTTSDAGDAFDWLAIGYKTPLI